MSGKISDGKRFDLTLSTSLGVFQTTSNATVSTVKAFWHAILPLRYAGSGLNVGKGRPYAKLPGIN